MLDIFAVVLRTDKLQTDGSRIRHAPTLGTGERL